MASSQLIALEAHVAALKKYFIIERGDYSDYIPEDHTKALAYMILASAAIEDYVEDRCIAIAKIGNDRLAKSKPTSAGRSLIVWYTTKNSIRATTLREPDPLLSLDLSNDALLAYTHVAKSTHGMGSKDLRKLVFPVGLRDAQLPDVLLASLDALSAKRNPAAHTYINRGKSMAEPIEESKLIEQILHPLRILDDDLQVVAENFPL